MIRHFAFFSLALIAAVAPAVADTTCPSPQRGCNPPKIFSAMTASDTLPTIVASTGISQDMKDKLNEGHQVLVNFIGGATPSKAYLWEPGGADAAYAGMQSTLCAQQNSYCSFSNYVTDAKAGGGQYHKGGGGSDCKCSHARETSSAVFYLPTSGDSAEFIGERGIHEAAHITQMSHGEYFPTWLVEGGAVHLECLLQKKLSWSTETYEECFKLGGGRGGIVPNFLSYYASSYGQTKGLKPGEIMPCGDFVGDGDTESTMTAGGVANTGHLFYDVGAVAIAWAMTKGNITSKQFWQSDVAGEGFWNAVVPWAGYDYDTGYPGECPDDKGWKKALLDITGHACMEAFYAEFDVWAGSATEASVLAILEAQCNVDAATDGVFDLSTAKSGSSLDPCTFDAAAARTAAAARSSCNYNTHKAAFEAAPPTVERTSACAPTSLPPSSVSSAPSRSSATGVVFLAVVMLALALADV